MVGHFDRFMTCGFRKSKVVGNWLFHPVHTAIRGTGVFYAFAKPPLNYVYHFTKRLFVRHIATEGSKKDQTEIASETEENR